MMARAALVLCERVRELLGKPWHGKTSDSMQFGIFCKLVMQVADLILSLSFR